MLALEDIKILDFTRNAPGMFCTMVLGDLGADVLMVERPMDAQLSEYQRLVAGINSPEDARRQADYNALQRNKRSISLNLREPDAREIVYQLAGDVDVVVEGFRPGVMDRLGVGYEKLSGINPRLVYCSISGYGQDGPYASMAGHDINYISFAAALGLFGHSEEERPAIPLNLIADYAGGGLCSAVAILAALMARGQTGRGQYVDIAMTEGVFYMMASLISSHFAEGAKFQRGTSRLNGGAPYYNVYQTKAGKYFTIAAIEPWVWQNLCRALDREDLAPHQNAQGEQQAAVYKTLQDTFLTRTRDEWFELLKDQSISVGKVYSLAEAIDDPQVVQRGMVVEVEAPSAPGGRVSQIGIPLRLSDTPGKVRHVGAVAGEHTGQVLDSLGYTPDQVEDLRRRRVVE